MAKLFLSYAREDASVAERLARALERAGHDVWWDRDLHGGASFGTEIERELHSCDVVVVLWSGAGLQSPWVRDEASIGRDSGKLLPVSLDAAEPPIGFRQFHTIELKGWRGGKDVLQKIEAAIQRLTKAAEESVLAPERGPKSRPKLGLPAAAAAAVLIAAIAVAVWLMRAGSADASVAIAPSSTGDGAVSREFAQSIAADMASFLPAHATEASVVEPERARDAAYLFSVSVSPKGQATDASLSLSTRGRPAVLWSRNWSDVDLKTVDLKKQMSLLAARAFMCALETRNSKPALRPSLAGLYIQGCASDDVSADEAKNLFSRITSEEPRFGPGWVGLAEAYQNIDYRYYGEREPVPPETSKAALDAIHTALRLNPRSGKAFIAQVPFVSKSNEDELRLYEKAVALDPDEAVAHQLYSYALQNVGRMRDAIDEAQRAVDLNPLSPSVRRGYISALTYAGRLDQAREKIAEAERIWPNSSDIVTEDFWFNFRYGDANRAEMLLLKTQPFTERGLMLARVFLKTRTQPGPVSNDAAVAAFVANEQTPRFANQALLTFGALKQVDKAFDLLNNREFLPYLEVSWLFRPELQPVRRDPRFMGVVARLGLIKYWRESGHWADFCMWEPLDYDCKAEARKYPD